jgi:hypothetical protein
LIAKTVLAAGFIGFFCCLPFGEARAAFTPPDYPTSVPAARITGEEAPTIDGDLSDPAWAKATVLERFTQTNPDTGAPPTERTVVRIMYDEDNFYFSVYAYHSQPELIALRGMSRDGPVFSGDNIRITLDPGPTRRNAYSFVVGPSGGRVDAIMQNNSDNLDEWDAIWAARSRRVADGWVSEIAIPFRSMSYVPGVSDWGFEFSRTIRSKNENLRWANTRPNVPAADVSQSGTLTGVNEIRAGLGLDIQPYAAARVKRDWHVPGEDTGISGTAGGNLFYKITPGLTGTLTFNPDFSDAPLDARQVNTTRFSLFVPETRDFFLQDIPTFEFGGRNFVFANNARPFFSRNIGLANGRPVSLVGGAKLSGEYAGLGIGALSVLTDNVPGEGRQVLSVARVTRKLLGESKAGFIVTHGDPTGETDNTVVGGDFQYRNSDIGDGKILQADGYYQRSFSSLYGEDHSWGVALNYPNEPWGGSLRVKEVGRNFEPALGFANRTAIREYNGTLNHITRFRDSWLRELTVQTDNLVVTDLNDNMETREHSAFIELETRDIDRYTVRVNNYFEAVPEPFDLPDGIIVPVGDYNWTNGLARIQTSAGRVVQLTAEVECCSFYDGTAVDALVQFNFRLNESIELLPRWEGQFIRLPGGDVDIHVLSLNATYNFTPEMQIATQAQYDNISKSFGFLARYRWEFTPASELFIAFGQSALIPGTEFKPQRSQLMFRVGHIFRL